jgi:hypothetical protein
MIGSSGTAVLLRIVGNETTREESGFGDGAVTSAFLVPSGSGLAGSPGGTASLLLEAFAPERLAA